MAQKGKVQKNFQRGDIRVNKKKEEKFKTSEKCGWERVFIL
jgi:hypothetical protein